MRLWSIVPISILALIGSAAEAATINYLDDSRSAQRTPGASVTPSVPFGALPWPGSQSVFESDHIRGEARSSMGATSENSSESDRETFSILFDVDVPVVADILLRATGSVGYSSVIFRKQVGGSFEPLSSQVCTTPWSSTGDLCAVSGSSEPAEEQEVLALLLEPGTVYSVYGTTDASSGPYGESGFIEFELRLRPVPEPGTGALLLCGLIVTGATRRRGRAASGERYR